MGMGPVIIRIGWTPLPVQWMSIRLAHLMGTFACYEAALGAGLRASVGRHTGPTTATTFPAAANTARGFALLGQRPLDRRFPWHQEGAASVALLQSVEPGEPPPGASTDGERGTKAMSQREVPCVIGASRAHGCGPKAA